MMGNIRSMASSSVPGNLRIVPWRFPIRFARRIRTTREGRLAARERGLQWLPCRLRSPTRRVHHRDCGRFRVVAAPSPPAGRTPDIPRPERVRIPPPSHVRSLSRSGPASKTWYGSHRPSETGRQRTNSLIPPERRHVFYTSARQNNSPDASRAGDGATARRPKSNAVSIRPASG